MKKVLSLILALIMCLSLCACGKNIERFCGGYSIRWFGYEGLHNDSVTYYALFEDGVLTIERCIYEPSSSSPSGKVQVSKETNEYHYELKGNNSVVIDGVTYTYEINDDLVVFDQKLMGIAAMWTQ